MTVPRNRHYALNPTASPDHPNPPPPKSDDESTEDWRRRGEQRIVFLESYYADLCSGLQVWKERAASAVEDVEYNEK